MEMVKLMMDKSVMTIIIEMVMVAVVFANCSNVVME